MAPGANAAEALPNEPSAEPSSPVAGAEILRFDEAPARGGRDKTAVRALFDEASKAYDGKDFKKAEELIGQALAIDPADFKLWNARGVFLRSAGRLQESVECYHRAIGIAPNVSAPWSNLGNSLADQKLPESAIACHQRAIELNPGDSLCRHNLGVAYRIAGKHREAIAAFNAGLVLKPNDPSLRWDRGLSHLALGEYGQGWADYEVRHETGVLPKRDLPGKRWGLNRFLGQRLLVIAEQGMGDAIWAARFLKQVKAFGGEVIVECRKELAPLIQTVEGVDRVVQPSRTPPEAEWHCYMCSLPGMFTPDLASVSGEPYLSAPAHRLAKFEPAMKAAGKRLRVGIVWSGSTSFRLNHERAVPFDRFRRAFSLPGVQLYSLQKGPPAAELKDAAAASRVIDLAPLLGDISDTAAAVSLLDLVIMTDSAVAHLGGALGTPVWLLLGYVPYWLWLVERRDSPWYGSVRFFRQRTWMDWEQPFDQILGEILAHLKNPRARVQIADGVYIGSTENKYEWSAP
jgi:tetratricopeptide (TPR) repeat protein